MIDTPRNNPTFTIRNLQLIQDKSLGTILTCFVQRHPDHPGLVSLPNQRLHKFYRVLGFLQKSESKFLNLIRETHLLIVLCGFNASHSPCEQNPINRSTAGKEERNRGV
ncbi:hypothetical protein CEXT_678911 [Caerostris extrusa]|uniref:LAGLIDADG homing endonuclease n=1 Tax=Caerostris extrusa TaxID=172846 RepID=A0AAV4MSP2_CAEEX|nr:hypothetical protein CEXT_678911 [Caerostris extrusa]